MMIIDTEKCIGCKQCVKDCVARDIEMVDGKAKIHNVTCIKCGHCIAICPKDAVTTDEYNMEEVQNYSKDKFHVDPENLLNFIKFRRSVRKFKKQDVEVEKLYEIIEAGRFTQTAINMQDVSYVVVKEGLEKLKELTLESLKNIGEHILANLTPETMVYKRYAQIWIGMYEAYKENPKGKDGLFFNAPAVIVVTANIEVNGSLASSNMELMTNALGLGTFFSGFFVRAAQENKEIRNFLEIKDSKQIVSCMVIGYPDIEYKRTVPRNKADIGWK
ncbi:nitroreductase family protein [Marinisporobacter balticus]|uniref:Nitroreductase n=1 Tax=Marinisporobacter balticus TaxID=2018667 RepID=A0A4R2L2K2_9FIRM|nr:nitroreductase family protein [Marinisporobacter balticus]TCO79447.1 nitroreductase [Marinisporobacter balticus]